MVSVSEVFKALFLLLLVVCSHSCYLGSLCHWNGSVPPTALENYLFRLSETLDRDTILWN